MDKVQARAEKNEGFEISTMQTETREYLRTNEAMMVFVVITVTRCSSRIFWNVPASWSAWQWVNITWVTCNRDELDEQTLEHKKQDDSKKTLATLRGTLRDEMPFLCKYCAECAGGSTRIPRPRIHKTKPAVVPSAEKPSADPRT